MNLKIVSLENFSKDVKKLFKKYKNISKDLKKLQDTLLKDPKSGIELGENLYKIRLSNSSIPTLLHRPARKYLLIDNLL